ncbi:hypothetical protein PGT21_036829 [Puccinia graminis f. sp. tritici]|uniref:Uncharacterized protein n=1 Tax=Puccinia graminis f. sp. tritici TaxID=56615 RepID=A0A5B0PE23_PUCGR|nr:hypothetical protein PGTUg99_002128 [Puccinia graminis f. sp. tritici]KAA1098608.1 hypothetical protein PGT21_036829 [Puccinia graminis f. sp. tritici]
MLKSSKGTQRFSPRIVIDLQPLLKDQDALYLSLLLGGPIKNIIPEVHTHTLISNNADASVSQRVQEDSFESNIYHHVNEVLDGFIIRGDGQVSRTISPKQDLNDDVASEKDHVQSKIEGHPFFEMMASLIEFRARYLQRLSPNEKEQADHLLKDSILPPSFFKTLWHIDQVLTKVLPQKNQANHEARTPWSTIIEKTIEVESQFRRVFIDRYSKEFDAMRARDETPESITLSSQIKFIERQLTKSDLSLIYSIPQRAEEALLISKSELKKCIAYLLFLYLMKQMILQSRRL